MGGLEKYPGRNLVIVDFGTATTFCAVTREREYLGGIITPGIYTSMAALESNTARLPAVEIAKPEEVLGRSTVESIQAGLYYGAVATVRWLVKWVTERHFPADPPVVLGTGSFGRLFEGEQLFDAFLPELPLLGLRRAALLAGKK
jgi:type III pantothenate kinase